MAEQLALTFTSCREPVAPREASVRPEAVAPADTRSPMPSREVARAIAARLAERLGAPVRLALHDNTRTMLSASKRDGRVNVRMHHMFLHAEADIIDAAAAHVGGDDPAASAKLGEFIRAHADQVSASRKRRRVAVRTRGRAHDLGHLLEDVLEAHRETFGGLDPVRITWGRRGAAKGRTRRSIRLGSFSYEERLIRIHPVLDQGWVPDYFIASVIHHELLHHKLRYRESGGRRQHHTPEFRRLERTFRHHEAAVRWEQAHTQDLLRAL